MDRKDAIIQMLDRDLEDSEEQYQMALRSHLMIVDALIDLQYTRVKALQEQFNHSLQVSDSPPAVRRARAAPRSCLGTSRTRKLRSLA